MSAGSTSATSWPSCGRRREEIPLKKHRQRWKNTRKDTRSKKNRPDVYAFYVNWDENSAISFQHNIRSIDVLIPEWYHINPDLTVKSEIQQNIARIAKSSNIKVMPLINNYTGNEWNKAEVHELLRDSGAWRRVIKELYYGLAGFYLLDRHFHQHFSVIEASRQTIAYLIWLSTPELEHPNRLARWFLDSLALIQIGGILYGLGKVLQPVVYRRTVLAAGKKEGGGNCYEARPLFAGSPDAITRQDLLLQSIRQQFCSLYAGR